MTPRRKQQLWFMVLAFWFAAMAEVTPAAPQIAPDALARCDQAHEAGDLVASEALAREILACAPDSTAAAWRLSRALIGMSNLEEDRKRRRGLLEQARSYAELAVKADPTSSEGFTCLAICGGNLAGLVGGRQAIEMAEEARVAAEQAITLDDTNDLAYLVLGVWNREIATLGGLKKLAAKIVYGGVPAGASLEESEVCLRRAVALAPAHINHHRELGITLMAMKHCAEAAEAFSAAVQLRPRTPADHLYRQDASERLTPARKCAYEARAEERR
jgi:tetratricopeptide (TPR) repeat protein